VANDDEQIFRSTDGATWTKVDDQNDNFSYWNDIGYNPQFGQAGLSSSLTNNDYSLTLESNGVVILPQGGAIAEGVVTDNPTIELTPAMPEAVSQKLVIKGGVIGDPTDYHLHLTTGDLTETSVILGTDEHNVRTTTNGTIQITTPTEGSNVWEFGTDGNLEIPGDIKSESAINIDINLSDSTLRRWRFGEDGELSAPGNITVTTDGNGTLTSSSGRAQLSGDDGAELWFDNGSFVTSVIGVEEDSAAIVVTDMTPGSSSQSSLAMSSAGNTTLASAAWINLITNNGPSAKTFRFDSDGALTLPAGGDIVDSDGVGQLANRVEGSWTVTAGTNTYSFTVPSDGTYIMWVKGNITNGIITWNATLSVTNSNVPAIGTQYAWNYTGGGTPISLTSIPDQIKGVAGTISTDATYEGTTSNRFDFGISNTSGASQTVYYGYTKI
jgi:hypothetical protein